MNPQAKANNGLPAAAMLAAGIGSLVLGLMTTLAENVSVISKILNFYNPVGALTGKTLVAIAIWLISWAVLAGKWRTQSVNFGKIYKWTLILVALGLVGTFPPFFDLF